MREQRMIRESCESCSGLRSSFRIILQTKAAFTRCSLGVVHQSSLWRSNGLLALASSLRGCEVLNHVAGQAHLAWEKESWHKTTLVSGSLWRVSGTGSSSWAGLTDCSRLHSTQTFSFSSALMSISHAVHYKEQEANFNPLNPSYPTETHRHR